MHKPIYLQAVSLSFPHKTCFTDFCHTIYFGQRIALIGRNGCGKSSLLKMIAQLQTPVCGHITIPSDVEIAYVPQLIDTFTTRSGAERFQAALTKALSTQPNLLLLDEPTNHLDEQHKKGFNHFLQHFSGTVIIATHDIALLNRHFDQFWHIENGQIHCFSGAYSDLLNKNKQQKQTIEKELAQLKKEKKSIHLSLMKEQQRQSASRKQGEKSWQQKKWAPVIGNAKSQQAQISAGKKHSEIKTKNQRLSTQLAELDIPEVITPSFYLTAQPTQAKTLIEIRDGAIGYLSESIILRDINLTVYDNSRIAIIGPNGSGKSTLIHAIRQNSIIMRSGDWQLPNSSDIGFLDQHYATLPEDKTVFEAMEMQMPSWSSQDIRRHLNDFLFRKNPEVLTPISVLSGGEKARLSLALIAAKPPKLLILDEVTNNLDIETKQHMIQVSSNYPSAFLIVSHDADFLKHIGITETISTQNFSVKNALIKQKKQD